MPPRTQPDLMMSMLRTGLRVIKNAMKAAEAAI